MPFISDINKLNKYEKEFYDKVFDINSKMRVAKEILDEIENIFENTYIFDSYDRESNNYKNILLGDTTSNWIIRTQLIMTVLPEEFHHRYVASRNKFYLKKVLVPLYIVHLQNAEIKLKDKQIKNIINQPCRYPDKLLDLLYQGLFESTWYNFDRESIQESAKNYFINLAYFTQQDIRHYFLNLNLTLLTELELNDIDIAKRDAIMSKMQDFYDDCNKQFDKTTSFILPIKRIFYSSCALLACTFLAPTSLTLITSIITVGYLGWYTVQHRQLSDKKVISSYLRTYEFFKNKIPKHAEFRADHLYKKLSKDLQILYCSYLRFRAETNRFHPLIDDSRCIMSTMPATVENKKYQELNSYIPLDKADDLLKPKIKFKKTTSVKSVPKLAEVTTTQKIIDSLNKPMTACIVQDGESIACFDFGKHFNSLNNHDKKIVENNECKFLRKKAEFNGFKSLRKGLYEFKSTQKYRFLFELSDVNLINSSINNKPIPMYICTQFGNHR